MVGKLISKKLSHLPDGAYLPGMIQHQFPTCGIPPAKIGFVYFVKNTYFYFLRNYSALPENLTFYISFVLFHGSVVVFSPHPTPPAPKSGLGWGWVRFVSDNYGNTLKIPIIDPFGESPPPEECRNDSNGHIAE